MTCTITAFERLPDAGRAWAEERRPLVVARVRNRLPQLSAHLGAQDWLAESFSAGDLLMVSVRQRIRSAGELAEFPNLLDYIARGEARPAYQRAFAAQLAVNAPGASPP